MEFNYIARNKKGEIQRGIIDAASSEAAATLLQKMGLYITVLEETAKTQVIYTKKIKLFGGVSRKDIVAFSRQLSILVNSEVPLIEALNTLSAQTEKQEFKEIISAICEDVEGGIPFSQALSEYPKLFSGFFVNLVKSGEASGKLSQILSYLADHLEREYYLISKVRGAMIYPAFVFVSIIFVLTIMIIFVFPQLNKVLTESGAQLPMITQFLVSCIEFLRSTGWIIFILIVLAGLVFWRWSKTPKGKIFSDKLIIRLPLTGDLLKVVYLSRFAENLSTLISGGLPIAEALTITGEVVGNHTYKEIIFQTRDSVRKGESISSSLASFPKEIPPLFTQMTTVGEKTGRLDAVLSNISEFYRKEVDNFVNNFISLIEPILIVVLGIFVGFFIISFLLPLYQGISGM